MTIQTFQNRVTLEKKNDIAYVTLSRADKYNGLDFAMMEGLVEAAKAVRKDKSLRVAIMQGAVSYTHLTLPTKA